MLTRYIKAALEQPEYELVGDSGEFFGRIPALDGVLANSATLESCRNELEVLEDWILVRLSQQLPVPAMQGISLGVQRSGLMPPIASIKRRDLFATLRRLLTPVVSAGRDFHGRMGKDPDCAYCGTTLCEYL